MALINRRNALMTGKRLPYDAEVEYLESTGTQWIDTGINAKQSLKIRAVFETNSSTSYFAYGVRVGDSTISCATGIKPNGTGYARWGTSAYAQVVPSGLVDITQDSSGVIVNGTSYSYDATQTVVEQSGYTMVLFAGRNSATTVTANMVGKFNSCKIWDNGVLVRDFIPVRVGNVGYLYDRVSKRLFGNAGTGDFVLGPDVVPVEHIESHGTEYIDTGFKADRSTVVKCALSVVSRGTNGYVVWGAAKGDGTSGLNDAVALAEKYNRPSTLFLLDTYNNNNTQSISYGQDMLIECVLSDGSITINGTTTSHKYYTLNKTADYPIWVFGENLAGNLFRPSQIKLRFLQIMRNGVLVRSFRPVRVGTDATSWEGAMMDVLTRRIYRNAGTGAFTYGNDLKYPIPAE